MERTFALPYVAGQFEDSEVAAARRLRLEEATSEFGRSLFAAVYSKTARPATKPVLGGLRRGTDGSFWVWPFSLAADAATTYHVVAVNGEVVATVAGPARFRLWEAGMDYLLGVSTDAEGVERVVLYHLERWKR